MFYDGLTKHNLSTLDIQIRIEKGKEQPIKMLLGGEGAVDLTREEVAELVDVLIRAYKVTGEP